MINVVLIIMEGNYIDIDADNSTCDGYFIIKFSPSTHTLQERLIINGQVISFGEMVCGRTYL